MEVLFKGPSCATTVIALRSDLPLVVTEEKCSQCGSGLVGWAVAMAACGSTTASQWEPDSKCAVVVHMTPIIMKCNNL